ncbi:MAG: T9SS type A sorting domain-containing protein, partial [Saprospiraceae bacterium]|nr:T9SS type A sorting domain-containing protein [Saprospiraceae bacterium]
GCYTFTITCNANCTDSISTNFEKCCAPEAEIVLDQEPDELCDYCFYNENTEQLLDVFVEIDGVEITLSTYANYFNFPYCDVSGSITCDPSLPTFVDLVSDINAWFEAFGFEGEAFAGNGPGTCKGINTPFWIQQSNVVFIKSYLYESNNSGFQMHPFLEDNCNGDPGAGPILKVINACLGAEFLWSTGETTYSIPFISGQNYSVTITCPDGCTTIVGFIPPLTLADENIEEAIQLGELSNSSKLSKEVNFKAYPNPARARFEIAFNTEVDQELQLNIYNTSGQLVEAIPIEAKVGNNTSAISTEKYQNGLFILELRGENNTLGYQKIVIVK